MIYKMIFSEPDVSPTHSLSLFTLFSLLLFHLKNLGKALKFATKNAVTLYKRKKERKFCCQYVNTTDI